MWQSRHFVSPMYATPGFVFRYGDSDSGDSGAGSPGLFGCGSGFFGWEREKNATAPAAHATSSSKILQRKRMPTRAPDRGASCDCVACGTSSVDIPLPSWQEEV